MDALRRGSPRRLAVQAYVDANLARKELAFRLRWGFRGRVLHVGHHDAHAASAFYASPFDEAAVLTLDRGGDFLSTTLQHGRGTTLLPLATVGNPDVFVQPAASDAGNALGAALWLWHHRLGRPREQAMDHAFWGPEFGTRACEEALERRGLRAEQVADAPAEAARLLADSRIVGWFQGRAEVGPRALGARSILADPRRADMKDVVNARVKRREPFRPFAPSVLHERGPRWFDGYYPNPFMLLVLPVLPERRERIPAVTHVDGSARLQTVTEGFNRPFHRLITEFERRTGVPVVLNTSFNLRGEPIVLRPDEAIEDFLASDIDALFLGDLLVRNPPPG